MCSIPSVPGPPHRPALHGRGRKSSAGLAATWRCPIKLFLLLILDGTLLGNPDIATNPRRLIKGLPDAFVGVADQGLQAVLSFAIILAFVHYSVPSEYAVYVIVVNAAMLVQSVQAALVITPMQTIVPAMEKERGLRLIGGLRKLTLLIAFVGCSIMPFLLMVKGVRSPILLVAAAVFAFTSVLRLRVRAEFYTRLKSTYALLQTAAFVVLAVILAIVLHTVLPVSAVYAFSILALSGFSVSLVPGTIVPPVGSMSIAETTAVVSPLWFWTLVGAGVAWLQLNIYLITAYFTLNLHETGMIAIARIFLLPINLVFSGISVALRPHFAAWMGHAEHSHLRAATFAMVGFGLLVIIGYVLVAYVLIAWLPAGIIPKKYEAAKHYFSYWLVDAGFIGIFAMAAVPLVAAARFRILALITLVSSIMGLIVTRLPIEAIGLSRVMSGQMLADLIRAVVAAVFALRLIRRFLEEVKT